MTEQEKIRAARAEYARQYRKRNPDKVKAAQERYWLRKIQKETKGGAENAKEKD